MPQNPMETREKIISFMKIRGPSLPVHIAKEIGTNILFASAFLSELLSEKIVKISNMRVGSSPIYFIPGQEIYLERFANFLKSKEKEAFNLLKQKKFLKDNKQQPAIRVALREIKDFAVPFEKNQNLYWKFFTVAESEFQEEKPKIKEIPITPKNLLKEEQELPLQKEEKIPISVIKKEEPKKEKEIIVFEKKEKSKTKKRIKKKIPKKQNDIFFNKVKEFLSKKSIDILDIVGFTKNELILKIKKEEEEKLFIAYNKKRINENDIINANKKSSELKLKYTILCLGDSSKKIDDLIEAIRNLSGMEKIE